MLGWDPLRHSEHRSHPIPIPFPPLFPVWPRHLGFVDCLLSPCRRVHPSPSSMKEKKSPIQPSGNIRERLSIYASWPPPRHLLGSRLSLFSAHKGLLGWNLATPP